MNSSSFFVSLFNGLINNEVLIWALIACGSAQLSKIIFEFALNGKFRLSILLETGGMPSSHSALVSGMASGVGIKTGFDDPVFAIAATVALVVMYDASGIRKSSGLIAERVNQLPLDSWKIPPDNPLKESLGHTKLQVLVGSILGPSIALPGIFFLGKPTHLFEILGLIAG
tara:strand:- start:2288 stop:2800 length:513 start_codon:yes stop_codon:yes gene_type:complete